MCELKMKKILISFLALSVLVLPMVSLAAVTEPLSGCTPSSKAVANVEDCVGLSTTAECTFTTDNCAICCLFSSVYTITDWVFALAIAVSSLMVIFGGFSIVTAAGDPSKVTSGRNMIMYAMIGFAVALFASAIPNVVKTLVGG